MKEAEIEAYLVQELRRIGGACRKLKWIGRRAAPDRFVMHARLPGGCCLVELKAPGKEPRPDQFAEHEKLRKHGVQVAVINSLDGVDRFIGCLK